MRASLVLLFLSLWIPFAYFNHSDGWNQDSRFAELHAIVLQGTVRLDAYHERTGDKAVIDGHYYSEKAPVITAIALPVFAATVGVQRVMGIDPDGPRGWAVSAWITTVASVGLLAALGGVAFYVLLESRVGAGVALIATFGMFLGTFTFPYAAALFAHAGTIGLFAIALWGVLGPPTPRRDYLAGLAAGCAVASEYPAILSCGVLTLYMLWSDRPRALRFVLGTIPAALLILANNYVTTGSPFHLTYGANPQFPEMTTGNLMGFHLPDASLFPAMLWSEYRGLFFWSPYLLMALPGVVVLAREDRAAAVTCLVAFTLIFMQVAAFYNWHGGNAFGMRYLSPALPFLGLVAAYGVKRFPEMGTILSIISIALMAMVTAIAIDPPSESLTPLQAYYLPRIEQHRFVDNLGTLMGLPLAVSLGALVVLPAFACWRLAKEQR